MKSRTITTRLLGFGVIGAMLVSQTAYSENSAISLALEISGFTLLCFASLGRTWASAFISGKKDASLTIDGPYSIVRNPLYFFSFLGFIGAGLAFESLITTFVFVVIFFLTHWSTILAEEKKLISIFGESYKQYINSVPRFIPKLQLLNNPNTVSFSPKIFTRSLFESSLILFVYPIAQIIEWLHIHAILPVFFTIF